ncbi:ABC transporter ATP-binding protein [Methylobacterium sp. ID0610]|uniref:ABC transporter ATP-binding protein n=1 Tax=Methylobacterium carpenticola TaxID=3344827 RepID=UPI0036A49437
MTAPAVELSGVTKSFGATQIIAGVDLTVPTGERHAIIGPNGAGKSTLFNLISGRLVPSSGTIRLEGADITGARPAVIARRGLARSFQVTNIFPKLTVWENVRCAVLRAMGYRPLFWRSVERLPGVAERTAEILDSIRLGHRAAMPAGMLAYAEQRALEIGISIASDARVILLDEPMAGMSHSESEHATALIREVTRGRTLLMVEHDMAVVFGLADRISVLVYGRLIATDTPERIRENRAVQEAYLGVAAA